MHRAVNKNIVVSLLPVARLRDEGFEESILWGLRGNQLAIAFYEAAGFAADGARKVKRRADGLELPVAPERDP